jgi:hypothetical protein
MRHPAGTAEEIGCSPGRRGLLARIYAELESLRAGQEPRENTYRGGGEMESNEL